MALTVEDQKSRSTAAAEPPGSVEPSPAGALEPGEAPGPLPPAVEMSRALQVLRFSYRQTGFLFGARRRLGQTFRIHGTVPGEATVVSHPDHVRSLFTAKVEHVPTLTSESPLRPVVGPNSVLTANGSRHLRQRKLLLPPFHGEAIGRFQRTIDRATASGIDRWELGRPIALAPRMQAITLDVIMSGIFGIDGELVAGSPEWGLRETTKRLIWSSTLPLYQVAELLNLTSDEPVGPTKAGLAVLDHFAYAVIKQRRGAQDLDEREDILSLLIRARTEEGEPLSDRELRDELLTLVLAGHETTANQLAWTWERLVRAPEAYERLGAAARGEDGPEAGEQQIEKVLNESMRSRPVIPIIGRRVQVPWRFGEFATPAQSPVAMSIHLLHHREDLYPEPFEFRPERWADRKPGTYELIPFGGGTRRCLGAALAMAEMRTVLGEMARRLEIEAPEPEPEHGVHRNVTMIPSRGARVVVRSRRA